MKKILLFIDKVIGFMNKAESVVKIAKIIKSTLNHASEQIKYEFPESNQMDSNTNISLRTNNISDLQKIQVNEESTNQQH